MCCLVLNVVNTVVEDPGQFAVCAALTAMLHVQLVVEPLCD
jgi:hypothetical protein